ncbi:hypothetical protein [Flavobacterium sp. LB1P71]|uniref:hypothetical protein n=1 Tax=unclassified Flavobacterium TaxID=196869 RepID=UPI003AACE40A
MHENRIWLSAPPMGGSELQYIQEAFDSNWIAPVETYLGALMYSSHSFGVNPFMRSGRRCCTLSE